MTRRVRIGRPPRPDHPEPVSLLMAAEVKDLLRKQAEYEGRAMGLVVEEAVRQYVAAAAKRRKRRTRRDRGEA